MATKPNDVRLSILKRLRDELAAEVALAKNLMDVLTLYLDQIRSHGTEMMRKHTYNIFLRSNPTCNAFRGPNGIEALQKTVDGHHRATHRRSRIGLWFICQSLQFCWSQTSHTKSSDEILKPFYRKGFSKQIKQIHLPEPPVLLESNISYLVI
nr:hypothetical protein [Tanacetum cinerariifolium]